MARTTTSIKGLFSFLLKPATDALYAETGRVITTEGWGRIGRNLVAKGLRALATMVEVEAAPVAEVKLEPVAVPLVCDVPASVVTVEALPKLDTEKPHYGMSETEWEAFKARFAPEPVVVEQKPAPVKPAKVAKAKPVPTAKPKPAPKGKPSKAPSVSAKPVEPLTVAAVAERLKTTPRAVRKWIEADRLKASKGAAGWTVAPADLDSFLATLDKPKGKPAKTLAK
jgi:outer membrane biosynthesis protein TonB